MRIANSTNRSHKYAKSLPDQQISTSPLDVWLDRGKPLASCSFLWFSTMILHTTKRFLNPSTFHLFRSRLLLPSTFDRPFTITHYKLAKDSKMPSGPPKHEMAYYPEMTTRLPSTSGEFRRVLWTGLYSQVVLMTVPVGGDIGDEVHTVDQALTFTSGTGKATIDGKDQDVKAGDLMVVPAGTQHQFVNTGPTPLVCR